MGRIAVENSLTVAVAREQYEKASFKCFKRGRKSSAVVEWKLPLHNGWCAARYRQTTSMLRNQPDSRWWNCWWC